MELFHFQTRAFPNFKFCKVTNRYLTKHSDSFFFFVKFGPKFFPPPSSHMVPRVPTRILRPV